MTNKKTIIVSIVALLFLSCSFTYLMSQAKPIDPKITQDTLKTPKEKIAIPTESDSLFSVEGLKLKPYKKTAHASYYADRFNGKKTADGSRFNNNKYTAAHKKLPFGTRLKVTNEANGKFVIVKITDRGPFVKTRELDLSKRAFMDITTNKAHGAMKVTIEIIMN
ncbi:septal ring lytic transglycosylase RlpA family protein [Flavobacterium sp. Fl-77]|uniref:Probable endolytic peptidoglycan transglycosylase RlpA n=1 Tax=Flavobacterium flavipigmentatum TaxID=2893884 RepID=A0AAJ2SCL3_9FLAO|nr:MULTISPECIES: septal ring lytic transglycosylase RlpA family protein [unclassified Flavobacterium]MDX6180755.1 septal ring lytic transglycosylase RlpA family protein [Flavobacterium sp. Fl-33]MDX6184355.1 septal ring lytic transglycosylase RlpA family protein [Flavobacterium sp. Fl-77]UFH39464.1 septal ring lytic transglycosylase RlpA family protein [Flavobacterium sp. F-70]